MGVVNRIWIRAKFKKENSDTDLQTLALSGSFHNPIVPSSSSSSLTTSLSSSSLNTSTSFSNSSRVSSPVKSVSVNREFQSLEIETQIKDSTHYVYHVRKVKLTQCMLHVYRKDKLMTEFNFVGGKVMDSRTENAIKIVAPDSTVFYIWFKNSADKVTWKNVINSNLQIVIANDWTTKAQQIRMKQTEDQILQHRSNLKM